MANYPDNSIFVKGDPERIYGTDYEGYDPNEDQVASSHRALMQNIAARLGHASDDMGNPTTLSDAAETAFASGHPELLGQHGPEAMANYPDNSIFVKGDPERIYGTDYEGYDPNEDQVASSHRALMQNIAARLGHASDDMGNPTTLSDAAETSFRLGLGQLPPSRYGLDDVGHELASGEFVPADQTAARLYDHKQAAMQRARATELVRRMTEGKGAPTGPFTKSLDDVGQDMPDGSFRRSLGRGVNVGEPDSIDLKPRPSTRLSDIAPPDPRLSALYGMSIGQREASQPGAGGQSLSEQLMAARQRAGQQVAMNNVGRSVHDMLNTWKRNPDSGRLYDALDQQAEMPARNILDAANLQRQSALAQSETDYHNALSAQAGAKAQHQAGLDATSGSQRDALAGLFKETLGVDAPQDASVSTLLGALKGIVPVEMLKARLTSPAAVAAETNASANAARTNAALNGRQHDEVEGPGGAPLSAQADRVYAVMAPNHGDFHKNIDPLINDLESNGYASWGARRGEISTHTAAAQRALMALEQRGVTIPAQTKERMANIEAQLPNANGMIGAMDRSRILAQLYAIRDATDSGYQDTLKRNNIFPRTHPAQDFAVQPVPTVDNTRQRLNMQYGIQRPQPQQAPPPSATQAPTQGISPPIPDAEKQLIVQSLQKRGAQPTEENIMTLYRKSHGG